MGQAKRRGDFEKRKAEALVREARDREEAAKKPQPRLSGKAATALMMAAALSRMP